MNFSVIAGNAHPDLAKALKLPLIDATVTTFPDGETQVTVHANVRGQKVFIIQPTCAPANQHYMELFILIDALRRASAKEIIVVLPYYGYARQDRKDRSRAPISAKLVANLLVASGTTRVMTMDLHASQIQGFFDIPVDHLYAAPLFVEHIKKTLPDNIMILAPDEGSIKRASHYAKQLNCGLGFVAKRRTGPETVEAINMVGEVAGKNVIIVDDLTESAGTLIQAANLAKQNGALSVQAYVSHGVLTQKGYDRLAQDTILDKLVVTDSTPVRAMPGKIEVISIAPMLSRAITHVANDMSLNALFDGDGNH